MAKPLLEVVSDNTRASGELVKNLLNGRGKHLRKALCAPKEIGRNGKAKGTNEEPRKEKSAHR